jgi:hypothetical protein
MYQSPSNFWSDARAHRRPVDDGTKILGAALQDKSTTFLNKDNSTDQVRIHHAYEQPGEAAHRIQVVKSNMTTFERVLFVITAVLVIVSCIVFLYSAMELYLFIGRVQHALQELSSNPLFTGGN